MKKCLFSLLALLIANSADAAETAGVVVSIKPLHSLVQGVMGDTGAAGLLLKSYRSPHSFSLKPSQVKMLQEADIVFYIDDTLESFLRNAVTTLPARVRTYAVARKAGLTILDARKEGLWATHKHRGVEHRYGEPDDHQADAHEPYADMHLWLDIDNAKQIVRFVAKELGIAYPGNQNFYAANARVLIQRLDRLDAELAVMLVGVRDRPFIVFHDAYQYFERHYGLTGTGALILEPDQPPSVNHLQKIRDRVEKNSPVCIFREPQFSDKLVNTVIRGSRVKSGILDPLGVELQQGPDLYFELLENLAQGFSRCLSR